MANNTVVGSTPPAAGGRKRFRWLRLLGIIFAALVVLLLVAYFVGTSSAFFKSFILPRVGKSVNATITVSDASISPFSQVVLKDLKVQTTGTEPLFGAPEVRLRYSLTSIIGGNIKVQEVSVSSPVISLVENPDGSSNLDPLLKGTGEKQKEQQPSKKPGQSSKPPQLDIASIAVTDATIRKVKIYGPANRDSMELAKANLKIDNVRNGQTGKITLGGDLNLNNNPPAPATNSLLQARIDGAYTFALAADLKPTSIQGNTKFDVTKAGGGQGMAAGFSATFDCDVTPSEIKQILLRLQLGQMPLGQLRVSGPFDMDKREGRIQVQLQGIDRQLFNLAGASQGMDFGTTTLSSTNEIGIANNGKLITAGGELDLSKFQITRTNQTTPTMDLRAAYNAQIDTSKSNLVLTGFTLTGNQQDKPLLIGSLGAPMTISWGDVSNAMGDSVLTMILTNMDLSAWKPFLGEIAPAGIVNGRLNLVSREGGKILNYDVSAKLDNLTVKAGTNLVSQLGINLAVNGMATNLQRFDLPRLSIQLNRKGDSLLSAQGTGTYDKSEGTADFQISAQSALNKLVQLVPLTNASIQAGGMSINTRVRQKENSRTVTGSFALTNFTATVGSNRFDNYALTADLDAVMSSSVIQIRSLTASLSDAGHAGGKLDLQGSYNTSNRAAQVTARMADLNENGLRPFLQPMLGDKQLKTILLSGNASAQYSTSAPSVFKAQMVLTNLVVNDPKNQIPATPLDARFNLDASLSNQVTELRQLQLGLTPAQRAPNNMIQLAGTVDATQTTNITGRLILTADSLDVTKYYDLFGGSQGSKATAQPSRAGQAPAPSTSTARTRTPAPEQEAQPTTLPFRNFVADAKIGRFYLREIEMTNIQTTVSLDGGRVSLKPFELAMNGAPVRSTIELDLGVPGYKYQVDFSANQVPLSPIVNSFQPERKGQVGGTLTGVARVTGQGTTGASLQRNLNGSFDLGSTNLNLAIPTLRSPLLKTIINVIAVVPELTKNPNAAVGTLTTALFGGSAARSGQAGGTGLMDELMQSPLDIIQARGAVDRGVVNLQQSLVQSPAFQASAKGTVEIRDILTNSPLNIPLTVALKRSLAEKINFIPTGTPTNQAYVKLPDYVTIKGTVGEPKSDINKMALLGTALQQLGGNIPGVDKKTGALLQNLGGMLGGGTQQGTNAASTNRPASGNLVQGISSILGGANTSPAGTNSAPSGTPGSPTNQPASAGSLLQGISSVLGGVNRTATNSPAATGAAPAPADQPGATNASPVGSLLEQLLRPKQQGTNGQRR